MILLWLLTFTAATFACARLLLSPGHVFRRRRTHRGPGRPPYPHLLGILRRPALAPASVPALTAFLAAAAYALTFQNLLAGAAIAPGGWFAGGLLVQSLGRMRERRVRGAWRVAVDLFPDFLEAAGSPPRALAQVAARVPEPVRGLLYEAVARHATGQPLGAALGAAAPDRAEVRLFARLLELAQHKSHDIAPAFRRLGRAIHEQHVLDADRRAEVAGAHLMALLLTAGPVAFLFGEGAVLPAARETLLGPARLLAPLSAAVTSLCVLLLVRSGRALS